MLCYWENPYHVLEILLVNHQLVINYTEQKSLHLLKYYIQLIIL